jgi:hypothetical protein
MRVGIVLVVLLPPLWPSLGRAQQQAVLSSRAAQRRLNMISCLMAAALSLSVIPALSGATTIRGAGASCDDYVRVYDAFRLTMDGVHDGDLSQCATANFLQYEEWIDGFIWGWRQTLEARACDATGIKSTLGNGFPAIARNIDRTSSRTPRLPCSGR